MTEKFDTCQIFKVKFNVNLTDGCTLKANKRYGKHLFPEVFPLLPGINKKEKFYCINIKLPGIVSFGMGCGGGTAGVYESVVHHKRWIDARLRQKTWKEITALINSKTTRDGKEVDEKGCLLEEKLSVFTENKFN